jgi:DNA-binding MarR family transcriptional regulator
MMERQSTVEEDVATVQNSSELTEYSDDETVSALESMFEETFALFQQLRATGDNIYVKNPLSEGMRSVLRGLERFGPQTVPQLARRRQCSRQRVQLLVNDLVDDDYVVLIENPAHKRSSLVDLTPRGRSLIEAMHRREMMLLRGLEVNVPANELREAAAVVRSVRNRLESNRWRRLLTDEQTKQAHDEQIGR